MATTSKYFKEASRIATRNKLAANEDKSPDEAAEQKISIEKIFAEITKLSTKLTEVAADVVTIKETTTELKNSVGGLQVRVEEAEERISRLEDTTEGLVTNTDTMGKKVDMLWDRDNVRLVGLAETYRTNGTLDECVKKVLSEGLRINPEAEFEIERMHRTLAPMPNEDQPPRPILIRFLRQSAREKVLRAATKKRGVKWDGQKLSIFPDLTKELAEKRKEFLTVKKALQQRNVRYTLALPATLRFTWKGKIHCFTNAEHVWDTFFFSTGLRIKGQVDHERM